ncbi:MAG: kanamycin nucleotidyltransferase C-terminal domain-containing protein [Ktedonobacteraceae bacterium]
MIEWNKMDRRLRQEESTMPAFGPQPLPRTQRMTIAHEIAERVKERFPLEVFAIGLYGSLAREEDSPYSDIELFGVLRTDHYKHRYEWCTAEWKAEVDLYGKQTLLERAARVDDRWPLTHSALQAVLPLYDPEQFFVEIGAIARSAPERLFRETIEELLVQEVYEGIGKIRNAQVEGLPSRLPALVLKLAQDVAMILGLANRHCYTTGTRLIPEAIALSDLPDGFSELGQVILTGDLRDGQQLGATCERLWQGINLWAQGHGYQFISPERIPF